MFGLKQGYTGFIPKLIIVGQKLKNWDQLKSRSACLKDQRHQRECIFSRANEKTIQA